MPKTQFAIKSKNGERVIGSSSLPTIVRTAADVFEHPDRAGEETRALALSGALMSAQDAGAAQPDLEDAMNLGEQIGLELKDRNKKPAGQRPEIVTSVVNE